MIFIQVFKNKTTTSVFNNPRLATTEEVTEGLKNEAVRRYKKGEFIYLDNNRDEIKPIDFNDFRYYPKDNQFYIGCYKNRMGRVFENGIWSDAIPTKTIQEAEELLKELGHNFKIV